MMKKFEWHYDPMCMWYVGRRQWQDGNGERFMEQTRRDLGTQPLPYPTVPVVTKPNLMIKSPRPEPRKSWLDQMLFR